MEQRATPELEQHIRDVVHQLVMGHYKELITDGRAKDWPLDVLEERMNEIVEREGNLIDLPDEAFDEPIALPIDDGGWRIDVHLWTVNGQSLYTLILETEDSLNPQDVNIEEIVIM